MNVTIGEQLEALIDAGNLRKVLDILANVCWDKAEHLQVNWQDESTARAWRRAAKSVQRCCDSNDVKAVS